MEEKGITKNDVRVATEKDNFFKAIRDNADEIAVGNTPSGFNAWD